MTAAIGNNEVELKTRGHSRQLATGSFSGFRTGWNSQWALLRELGTGLIVAPLKRG